MIKMNILITGASGLLGNHLTRLFLSTGNRVRVMVENEKASDLTLSERTNTSAISQILFR